MKILLVEDDPILSDSLHDVLKEVGDIKQVYDDAKAICEGEREIYDLIVLDSMLPGSSGEEVLSSLRKNKINTPVLILTAKNSFEGDITGFRIGVDDYLTKPFHREELLLRVKAIRRRSLGLIEGNEIKVKGLTIEMSSRRVMYNGVEVLLQGKEFDLLAYLIQNKGRIVTKDQLFDRIWGLQSDETLSVVEVYMNNLKKHMKPFSIDKWIKTLRNVGYIFQVAGE